MTSIYLSLLALVAVASTGVDPQVRAVADGARPTVVITDCARDPHIAWDETGARIDLPSSAVELACNFGYDEEETALRITADIVTVRHPAKVKVSGTLEIKAGRAVLVDGATVQASYLSLWATDLVQARDTMLLANYGTSDIGCMDPDCRIDLQSSTIFADNVSVYGSRLVDLQRSRLYPQADGGYVYVAAGVGDVDASALAVESSRTASVTLAGGAHVWSAGSFVRVGGDISIETWSAGSTIDASAATLVNDFGAPAAIRIDACQGAGRVRVDRTVLRNGASGMLAMINGSTRRQRGLIEGVRGKPAEDLSN